MINLRKDEKALDKRRKYYLVLDTETATLPFADEYDGAARKKIAIAKPLIYDIGWQIIDNKGNVYRKRSFLITEIFSVPAIFNTAYYATKRPIYLERLERGEITLKTWREMTAILDHDLQEVEAVGAFNAMFDFKKSIPFTELYISNLYGANVNQWLEYQHKVCDNIASSKKWESEKDFEPDTFRFHGKAYKLFDLWGLSARHLLNNDDYRQQCINNNWLTESGKFFKTSAETTFRYLTNDTNFEERHTAIEDTEIESEIFAKIYKTTKGKFECTIIYFPFREVGKVEDFVMRCFTER